MSIISAIIQGLVQGFTEFLPVSSSGHLSLYQYFTGISSESAVLFSVMLHFGTLVAVLIAFWKTIKELLVEGIKLIGDIFTLKAFKEQPNAKRRMIFMLMLSCVPLFFILPFKDTVEGLSADRSILAEGICFLGTALLLTVADKVVKGSKNARTMKWGDAVGIGIAQAFATLPGISRSGSTISAGLICGLNRSYAVAYSFILGMPAILGAGLLDLKDLVEVAQGGADLGIVPALIGMAVAAVSGLLAIRLVNYIVTSDKFRIFAIYTCVLGLIVTAIAIVEIATGNAVQQWVVSLIG